jgi:hypothetical protein
MLENIPAGHFRARSFRYAAEHKDHQQRLADWKLAPDQIREMLDVLRALGLLPSADEYLDAPFRLRPDGKYTKGRFSDGSFPVFYSALEIETVKAEVKASQVRYALGYSSSRLVHFVRVSCQFVGQTKDLRPHFPSMQFLTAPQNPECHQVGSEAHGEGLDGLLTPSAARLHGTCLPVFRRSALSDPHEEQAVVFSLNQTTNSIELSE